MDTWVTQKEYRIRPMETQFEFVSRMTENVEGTERDLKRNYCRVLRSEMLPDDWIHKESASARIYFSPATSYQGKGIGNFRKGVFRYLDVNNWSVPQKVDTDIIS